ncbi:unnamed protein product [Albugo candida]|uniref:BZIP domain-containing protein n=1 Tax=Albugo candida TaxID=65357 RepID=A0A024FVM4_9STRA|nr:unnamed protein product [Albugo candida]|eukprot:CCI11071.1 unnamed protein product [Albugo candida]
MTTESNKYSNTELSRASRKKSNSERGKEFRAKRRKYEMELVSTVFALRKEVDDLQTSIETRLDASNAEIASERKRNALRLVTKYLELFRNGIPRQLSANDDAEHPTATDSAKQELLDKQLDFISMWMHDGVVFGAYTGIRSIIDYWERFAKAYSQIELATYNIESIYVDRSPLIVTKIGINVVVTENTLSIIFPGVSRREPIYQRILGQKLCYRASKHFLFDENGKIAQYHTDLDIVQALMEANMTIQEITFLLDRAIVDYHQTVQTGGDHDCQIRACSFTECHSSDAIDSKENNKYGIKYLIW